MKALHGFLQDEKWYEDLGHIGLGILPIDELLWVREWTKEKLLWPFKGQWPPGDVMRFRYREGLGWTMQPLGAVATDGDLVVVPLDRVSDIGRDELGYQVGRTIRNCTLIGLLIWRW